MTDSAKKKPRPREVGEPPTARQAQCLWHIHDYVIRNGFPPSIQDVGKLMQGTSRNAVQTQFLALRQKGYIDVQERTARGCRITELGRSYLEQNAQLVADLVARGAMAMPMSEEKIAELSKLAASGAGITRMSKRQADKDPRILAARAARAAKGFTRRAASA